RVKSTTRIPLNGPVDISLLNGILPGAGQVPHGSSGPSGSSSGGRLYHRISVIPPESRSHRAASAQCALHRSLRIGATGACGMLHASSPQSPPLAVVLTAPPALPFQPMPIAEEPDQHQSGGETAEMREKSNAAPRGVGPQ